MMDGLRSLVEKHATLADLHSGDNRILLSKGISDNDWAIWRMAQPEDFQGNKLLTAQSILDISDIDLANAGLTAKDRQGAADALMGAILEETNTAIIEPGARERAMTVGRVQKGTLMGELALSMLQFKSFPIAMWTRHIRRAMNSPDKLGAATYIVALVVGTTLGGALGLQINEIAGGRDPLDMTDKDTRVNGRFLFRAMVKGGALGIYGDFLQSQTTQHGQSTLAAMMGPTAGLIEELISLTQGNLVQSAMGEYTRAGAEALKFAKGLIPGTSVWYAKAAFDHLIFQNLQEAASPGYLGRMESRAQREFGQQHWWPADHRQKFFSLPAPPKRGPNLARAVGGN